MKWYLEVPRSYAPAPVHLLQPPLGQEGPWRCPTVRPMWPHHGGEGPPRCWGLISHFPCFERWNVVGQGECALLFMLNYEIFQAYRKTQRKIEPWPWPLLKINAWQPLFLIFKHEIYVKYSQSPFVLLQNSPPTPSQRRHPFKVHPISPVRVSMSSLCLCVSVPKCILDNLCTFHIHGVLLYTSFCDLLFPAHVIFLKNWGKIPIT